MEQQHTTGVIRQELMTTTEAAEYLRVSKSMLYKMTHNRIIPYYKPSGRICYFRREDLDAWMTGVRVSAAGELDAKATSYSVTLNRTER